MCHLTEILELNMTKYSDAHLFCFRPFKSSKTLSSPLYVISFPNRFHFSVSPYPSYVATYLASTYFFPTCLSSPFLKWGLLTGSSLAKSILNHRDGKQLTITLQYTEIFLLGFVWRLPVSPCFHHIFKLPLPSSSTLSWSFFPLFLMSDGACRNIFSHSFAHLL